MRSLSTGTFGQAESNHYLHFHNQFDCASLHWATPERVYSWNGSIVHSNLPPKTGCGVLLPPAANSWEPTCLVTQMFISCVHHGSVEHQRELSSSVCTVRDLLHFIVSLNCSQWVMVVAILVSNCVVRYHVLRSTTLGNIPLRFSWITIHPHSSRTTWVGWAETLLIMSYVIRWRHSFKPCNWNSAPCLTLTSQIDHFCYDLGTTILGSSTVDQHTVMCQSERKSLVCTKKLKYIKKCKIKYRNTQVQRNQWGDKCFFFF